MRPYPVVGAARIVLKVGQQGEEELMMCVLSEGDVKEEPEKEAAKGCPSTFLNKDYKSVEVII